jgi:hypothetical protein
MFLAGGIPQIFIWCGRVKEITLTGSVHCFSSTLINFNKPDIEKILLLVAVVVSPVFLVDEFR